MSNTIFFSWQVDRPSRVCRHFIERGPTTRLKLPCSVSRRFLTSCVVSVWIAFIAGAESPNIDHVSQKIGEANWEQGSEHDSII